MLDLLSIFNLATSESATIQLTPSSVNVCPGELVTVKYTLPVTNINYTRWTIIPESSVNEEVELTLNDNVHINEHFTYILQTNFRVEWASFSPLAMLKIYDQCLAK